MTGFLGRRGRKAGMSGKSDLLFLFCPRVRFCLVMFWYLCGVSVFGRSFDACLRSCVSFSLFCHSYWLIGHLLRVCGGDRVG